MSKCTCCDAELTDENWYPHLQKNNVHICRNCRVKKVKAWRKNPEKARLQSERDNRRHGRLPMSKNKECSCYLGVHVAERVLKHVFKDVETMPHGNVGFDFRCNQGKLIDVKAACARIRGNKSPRWEFMIRYNKIADYFLCLAFDNREDLNPVHIWLLHAEKFNHSSEAGISLSVIKKWDEYKLDIDKVVHCCNTIRK